MTKQDTETWIEKDKKQLHPTYHPKSHANPLVIERGEGVWLYTTDGQKILDAMAGLWNVNAGYGREELAKTAYDQMKELAAHQSGRMWGSVATTYFVRLFLWSAVVTVVAAVLVRLARQYFSL